MYQMIHIKYTIRFTNMEISDYANQLNTLTYANDKEILQQQQK